MPQGDIHPMEGYPPLLVGRCSLCATEQIRAITVMEDGHMVSSHLYIKWEEETYQLLFHIKESYFAVKLVSRPKTEIYRSKYIPEITLINAVAKLKTILTFL